MGENVELGIFHSTHFPRPTLSVQSPVVVNLVSAIVDEVGVEQTVQGRTTEDAVSTGDTRCTFQRLSFSVHINGIRLVSLQHGPILQDNHILFLTSLQRTHLIELYKGLHLLSFNGIQQFEFFIGNPIPPIAQIPSLAIQVMELIEFGNILGHDLLVVEKLKYDCIVVVQKAITVF